MGERPIPARVRAARAECGRSRIGLAFASLPVLAGTPPEPRTSGSWLEWTIYVGLAVLVVAIIRAIELARRRRLRRELQEELTRKKLGE
ncbi:MAG TPA: hypothetical protein VMS56_14755 [Thermoanaerobaculia bacterium]|nr:hypothetical protein [Thermoanaerobaculia bacterium]